MDKEPSPEKAKDGKEREEKRSRPARPLSSAPALPPSSLNSSSNSPTPSLKSSDGPGRSESPTRARGVLFAEDSSGTPSTPTDPPQRSTSKRKLVVSEPAPSSPTLVRKSPSSPSPASTPVAPFPSNSSPSSPSTPSLTVSTPNPSSPSPSPSSNDSISSHASPSKDDLFNAAFKEQLADPDVFALFREFLETQHAEEHIDFWASIEAYRLAPPDVQAVHAATLHKIYLSDESMRQVNLPSKLVKQIETQIKTNSVSPSTFDAAQTDVVKLMRQHLWLEFQKSDGFKSIQEVKDKAAYRASHSQEYPKSPRERNSGVKDSKETPRAKKENKFTTFLKQLSPSSNSSPARTLAGSAPSSPTTPNASSTSPQTSPRVSSPRSSKVHVDLSKSTPERKEKK